MSPRGGGGGGGGAVAVGGGGGRGEELDSTRPVTSHVTDQQQTRAQSERDAALLADFIRIEFRF